MPCSGLMMVAWLFLGLLFVPGAWGGAKPADTDGDGIPDAVEQVLGARPQTAETFVPLIRRTCPAAHKDPARFVTEVAMANVGGNRFVWRVRFAATYPRDNSNLILYLDADNDPKTGRPGHGCEFMLRVTNGQPADTGFAADGQRINAVSPRCAVAGPDVYVSFDTNLKQERGKSVFRMMVLSETWKPHIGVDSVGYFTAEGPAMSDRPKLKLDSDLTESEGVEQTYGLPRIDAVTHDPGNVVLPVFRCKYEGFAFRPSEYRADNVVRVAAAGKIVATVPRGGVFYPGFVFYDSAGREVIGISVNGRRRGVAVANLDDNNQHLFFLSAPVTVKPGDTIELHALRPEGAYRTEEVVLLARKPDPRAPVYEFRYLTARRNVLTWVTTWPAACTVEQGDGTKIREREPVNNHRVELPSLQPGQSVRYRLVATTRDGKRVQTEWRDYTWRRAKEPPTTDAGAVKLRVEVPGAGVANWPVTGGVPFPAGVLGSARNVTLTTAAGKTVRSRATVTGRWADGSVKWLLLDFLHTGSSADYRLHYGPAVDHRLLPTNLDSGPGGPARPRGGVNNGGAVHPAADPLTLGSLVLRDAHGDEYRAELNDFTGEEGPGSWAGASGRLANAAGRTMFAYTVRVQSYPRNPGCKRVQLTFGNDVADSEFTTIQSLRWELPVTAQEKQFVRQHTDDHYVSSSGEGKRWSGPLGPIWVRDFWQNYPKDLEVGPEGATLWLLPPLKKDEYTWAKGTVDEHRLFFWFEPLPDRNAGGYKLRQGMTKTHEVWLGTDGAPPQLDRPLFPACTPGWYAGSGAFGPVTIADPNRPVVNEYDAKVRETLTAYLNNREKNREYGLFNFGDWWGERGINWGNIEYDTQHAFFLQFIRSGDLQFLRVAEEAEVHNRDIDTIHFHRDPHRVGRVYAHCVGHVGDYYTESPVKGKGIPGGHFSVMHTWTEGHFDHYFLTGDRRSFETGLMIARNYDTYDTLNYDFTNCRVPGWHLILSLAAYRATGDPFHLNACRIIVERVLERQTLRAELGTAGGGWRRRMVPGHCYCHPAHYGNAGFMVGVLLTGLRWYHQATGDPRVLDSIHRASRFLIDDMWADDVHGFRYTSCPKSSKGAWSNFLLFDGMAYAFNHTGDAEIGRVLRAGTDSAIAHMSGMGKSFTQYIRVAPHFLGTLADLRQADDENKRRK